MGLRCMAEKCRVLRKLHIDGWKTNRIDEGGLMSMARHCLNLEELVINVNVSRESLQGVGGKCEKLERLAMCGCETMGDAEIGCIAAKCMVLRKLCIKSCPAVSDHGPEALADGCPNMVKLKLKKCKGVTSKGAAWLRATRESLAVHLDASSSSSRLSSLKAILGLISGRNNLFRRWSTYNGGH